MDVWVFLAAKEPHLIHVPALQLIEVFSFEPSEADKKRALRDFLDRKLGWDSYERDEKALREEDLDRLVYHWPKSLFKVFQKSLRGPDEVKTEDGYVFKRQSDGTYTDGDLTFEDIGAFGKLLPRREG